MERKGRLTAGILEAVQASQCPPKLKEDVAAMQQDTVLPFKYG